MNRQQIYTALLKAADHIEKHPEQHAFMAGTRPDLREQEPCGCALAWIGHYADVPGDSLYYHDDVARILFSSADSTMHDVFYGVDGRIDVPAETVANNIRRFAEEHYA